MTPICHHLASGPEVETQINCEVDIRSSTNFLGEQFINSVDKPECWLWIISYFKEPVKASFDILWKFFPTSRSVIFF